MNAVSQRNRRHIVSEIDIHLWARALRSQWFRSASAQLWAQLARRGAALLRQDRANQRLT